MTDCFNDFTSHMEKMKNSMGYSEDEDNTPIAPLSFVLNSARVLNVLQGEVAHCTPRQQDEILSTDATTCHIVAVWSSSQKGVLCSLCHVDCCGEGTQRGLDEMMDVHESYHWEESESVRAEAHITGGYDDGDEGGTSDGIGEFVLRWMNDWVSGGSDVAGRRRRRIILTLRTCRIGKGNTRDRRPIARGLILNTLSGNARLLTERHHLDGWHLGPALSLRGCRSYSPYDSSGSMVERMWSIHPPGDDGGVIFIEPYRLCYNEMFLMLLTIENDDLLTTYTSTSPKVEKSNFVSNVRECLHYLVKNGEKIDGEHILERKDKVDIFDGGSRWIVYKRLEYSEERCLNNGNGIDNGWC
eukprot:CAMPEP_0194284150 /NCGR_PEP_ID=MMETSP0169-20130528/26885_1 /TAXON_ID=218684 /ORGANISM="Corethron pennatum, Strain L29A3" /LENGTH=355 /DNA_ID=CAMNT_0039029891 /DNA_START=100 /DNA_END=1164 /DNA_ORIENTATION=-